MMGVKNLKFLMIIMLAWYGWLESLGMTIPKYECLNKRRYGGMLMKNILIELKRDYLDHQESVGPSD